MVPVIWHMKTWAIMLMMLFAFTTSQAQFKGVPVDFAISFDEVKDFTVGEMFNVLIKINQGGAMMYTYIYEVNSKGYSDALNRLKGILEANGVTRSADTDESYFPDDLDENDYNEVAHALFAEDARIDRSWELYDGDWKIIMTGDDQIIMVSVVHFLSWWTPL